MLETLLWIILWIVTIGAVVLGVMGQIQRVRQCREEIEYAMEKRGYTNFLVQFRWSAFLTKNNEFLFDVQYTDRAGQPNATECMMHIGGRNKNKIYWVEEPK